MSHVSNVKGCLRCIYCRAKQKICEVCKQPFHFVRADHSMCSARCRKRKSRALAKLKAP